MNISDAERYRLGGGGPGAPSLPRPYITVVDGRFFHNNIPMRVVLRRSGKISVGCTDVRIDALRELIRRYESWQRDDEVVIQEGC
jgi:hypothetical protein